MVKQVKKRKWAFALCGALLFHLAVTARGPVPVTLVKEGVPVMKILVDKAILPLDQADEPGIGLTSSKHLFREDVSGAGERRLAVRKLAQFIKQMSGAQLQVEAATRGASGIYVGLAEDFPWLNQDVQDLGSEGFMIKSDKNNLFLLAKGSLGVRAAAISFLMDQGCRWFFPGKTWEVIPVKRTIEGAYDIRSKPSFDLGRTFWYGFGTYPELKKQYDEWFYYNRMGGPMPIRGGHSLYGIDIDSALKYHPEWIAMVNGKRQPPGHLAHVKFCYSNPEVIQQIINHTLAEAAAGATSINLSPSDGLGFCECERCMAVAMGGKVEELHGTLFTTRPDGVYINIHSENYFKAVNETARALRKKYPGVLLGSYGYSAYSHPPSFDLEPNVFLLTTTHFRRTPLTLEEQLDMWGRRAKMLGIRGYWSVAFWDWDKPEMGKFNPEDIQKDLLLYQKMNANGFNTEASNNWGPRGLSYYVGANLLWDVKADYKKLVKDFYEKAFGPAAAAMERYYVRYYGPSVAITIAGKQTTGDEVPADLGEFSTMDKRRVIAKEKLIAAIKDLDEAVKLVAEQKEYRNRINDLRMYAYYLVLGLKYQEAVAAKDSVAIVEAIKNETAFTGRIANTNMVHSFAWTGKAFATYYKPYLDLLKHIPGSQNANEGWRKAGIPPDHEELEQLWNAAKQYLGIASPPTTVGLRKGSPNAYPFVFKNVAFEAGVLPEASNIRGHGAGWGDVNGDGWPDLYVGTFNDSASKPNMLFLNKQGKFALSEQQALRISARTTGVAFADLDNDGDLDLYVGSMPELKNNFVGNSMFENDGKGNFRNISEGNAACPKAFGGRSVTVLDYDGDGLLDLLSGEDAITGYNGSETKSSRLFRNKGGLQFEDVSEAAGISQGTPGYGVVAADINNDGWPDFFLASADGGNKLFINNRNGVFREASGASEIFAWPGSGGDKMVCGVSISDVNRDGLPDIMLGPHFIMPAKNPQPVRLFLNQGNDAEGNPKFREVTEEAGLKPISMKCPHVEFQDFDNDGWPDISTSIVRFSNGEAYPVIFKHTGLKNGIPVYRDFEINDFPTEGDKKVDKSADFWDKMIKEEKIMYMAPGPTGDYNNDGKMDIFLPNWWLVKSALLLRNETPGGNWLQVQVADARGVNRMGVGARVNIYAKGKLGNKRRLLGSQDIGVGYGYASGHQAMAHFGLGKLKKVDVEVILPHGKGIFSKRRIAVNQRIAMP
ncbi:MAG: DUF4838 domain-containing protein [Chitinophagaceae bacterium]|nr:DUF4838 domain-containing protein [Chitinophagaceae bacterium]